MDKLISIIVPIYNVERYLDRQLNAIRNQTYKNFQCIMVNDGSTDNSKAICEKYVSVDSRFILVNQDNKGVSAARNHGLRLADGEYIAFADADDVVEQDIYEFLIGAIEYCKVDVVSGRYIKEQDISKIVRNSDLSEIINLEKPINYIFNTKYNIGSIKPTVFRKGALEGLCFDESISYTEDELFGIEVISRCTKMAVSEEVLYHYLDNVDDNNSLTKKIGSYSFWSGHVRAMKKAKDILERTDNDELKTIGWTNYGHSIFSLFRLSIQLQDKESYLKYKKIYAEDIQYFFRISADPWYKKLTYTSYFYNYFIANLFHYYFKKK